MRDEFFGEGEACCSGAEAPCGGRRRFLGLKGPGSFRFRFLIDRFQGPVAGCVKAAKKSRETRRDLENRSVWSNGTSEA